MTVATSLQDDIRSLINSRLAPVDDELTRRYPGDQVGRQPVHTVYVPAHLFSSDTPQTWGEIALRAMDEHVPAPADLGELFAIPAVIAGGVRPRIVAKLRREPVEDLRIDFASGYGSRGPGEEDDDAVVAGSALAMAVKESTVPPYSGIRIKSFAAPTRDRAIRTLDVFLTSLLSTGSLPDHFVVALPEVSSPAQVTAMVELCEAFEEEFGLPRLMLRFELELETPQAILGGDGLVTVPRLIAAAAGRCTALHYVGPGYRLTGGSKGSQHMLDHPMADFAKVVMQTTAAGTGVRVSDGSVAVLPVGDHTAIRRAWRLHHDVVRRALQRSIHQGRDLHPAQLVSRYAAVFSFYREILPSAATTLWAHLDHIDYGEGPVRALADLLLRGLDCGALKESEVKTIAELDRRRLERLADRTARDS